MKKLLIFLLFLGIWPKAIAQNIVQYEYWYDTNYSNNTVVNNTPSSVLDLNTSLVGTNSLTPGLHNVNFRAKDNNGKWSSTILEQFYATGNWKINSYEYWFDDDYASKTTTSILPTQTYILASDFNTTSVGYGLHSLNFRSKDNSGKWSIVIKEFFFKSVGGTQLSNAEYWIDTNFANRQPITFTSSNSIFINQSVLTSNLDDQLHTFNFRIQDQSGKWSVVTSSYFMAQSQIVGYEYWFDANYAQKTSIVIAPTQLLTSEPDFIANGVTTGNHIVHFRAKNNAGKFSATISKSIIVNATYYQDSDNDGYGNSAVSIVDSILPNGYVTNSTDCNDANPSINPGHAEALYNGIDDNCDGNLDEGHQLTTKVRLTQCGTTLATLQSTVYSNEIVTNATGYRYKIVNNTTGATQYLVKTDSTKWWFQFSVLPSYSYNTAYTISVELQVAGTWLGYYGAECVVNTPSATNAGGATLNPASCGATLTSYNQNIAANNIANATVYRIKLTNATTSVSQTIDRSLPWFNMTMFTPKPSYGTTYNLEIAVKTATSDFGSFGTSCSITTPAVEGLQVASCGVTAITRNFAFYTNTKPNVNYYVFELTNTVTNAVQYISRTSNWFNFSHCPSGFTVNTFYSVRVAYSTDPSSWSAFSTSCTIKSPAALTKGLFNDVDETTVANQEFKVLALPNPFSSNFGLDMTSFTDSNVTIQIYDMIGKLLESREVKYTEVVDQTMGDNFPSGVYNVIVSQGEIIRTLRVIKR
jgi:hypothetical protein